MTISILGLGSFGYALLRHLDRNDSDDVIQAWDIRTDIANELESSRCHPVVGDTGCLSSRVKVFAEIEAAVAGVDVVILCVASEAVESVLEKIKPHLKKDICIINTAKSLDTQGRFISHTVESVLHPFYGQYGVLSGATKAEEVLAGSFVSATFASEHQSLLEIAEELFSTQQFHLSTTLDVEATELAGVAKNVITLLYGYTKGYGYSDTQVEYVFAKVMHELELLKPTLTDTALLPAWNIDILMSAHADTRNVRFGYELGRGTACEDISPDEEMSLETVEGWSTLELLPNHPVLVQSAMLMAFYHLCITKELTHPQWEEILFA